MLAAPPQLNQSAFATCFARHGSGIEPDPPPDLHILKSRYNFSEGDGLLPYLAIYPAERLPGWFNASVQAPAFRRWSVAFDEPTHALATWMRTSNASTTFTPGSLYRQSRAVCEDAFCAALVMHNTLRVFGRHEEYAKKNGSNFLPAWWRADAQGWVTAADRLRMQLLSIRRDGGGERWGEWYHTVGLLAYGIHEAATLGPLEGAAWTAIVARLNAVPWPVPKDPVKCAIDRDAAGVAALFVNGSTAGSRLPSAAWSAACSSRAGYVLLHDASSTDTGMRRSASDGGAGGGQLVWRARVGAPPINETVVWSSPLVMHERVYLGSRDERLYTLDAKSGRKLSVVDAGGYVDSSPRPSHDQKSFFIGLSGAWSVAAFDASTMQGLWRTKLNGKLDATPCVSPDGATVAATDDSGQTHMLAAATGAVLWSAVEPSMLSFSSPAFSPDGLAVYVGLGGLSGKGGLVAYRAGDGKRLWKREFGGSVQSSPTPVASSQLLHGAIVLFGSWDGFVYAVDAADGATLWSHATAGRVDATAHTSADGAVAYIGSWDGCLYALDVATGKQHWRSCTGGGVRSSAALSGDGTTVFVGSADGHLYAFRTADGAVRWRSFCGHSDPNYGVRSSPALSHDELHVYVGSSDGYAYAIRSGLSPPRAAAAAQ